ncbi:MAG: TlpA family protein disulfide reductase [Bacteroidota bacterium]|nr:TlpA family protein disulfide reductase [Bacteroidota bacterium]
MLFLSACSNHTEKEIATTTATVQTHTDSNAAAAGPATAAPSALPSFNLQDVNGKIVKLQSFKGKKIFVNLWATWCPPCRVEIPSIEKLYAKADKEKAVFIMLSLDRNFEVAKQYAKRGKMAVPVYYPAENLPALFETDYIPASFIFDEKGALLKRIDGMADYSKKEYVTLFQ